MHPRSRTGPPDHRLWWWNKRPDDTLWATRSNHKNCSDMHIDLNMTVRSYFDLWCTVTEMHPQQPWPRERHDAHNQHLQPLSASVSELWGLMSADMTDKDKMAPDTTDRDTSDNGQLINRCSDFEVWPIIPATRSDIIKKVHFGGCCATDLDI